MNIEKGTICPICGRPLQEGEDIVVCPDCGAPHHRTCWKAHGQCGHPERHSAAGPVQPETPVAPETPAEAPAASPDAPPTKVCPYCRTDNDTDARFCHHCGHPFLQIQSAPDISAEPLPPTDNTTIDGVPAKDVARVIGPRSFYYLRIFKVLSKSRRVFSLNLAALFFDIPWFFTRKMYLQAIGVTLVELALAIPSVWGVVATAMAGEVLQFSSAFWTLYHVCGVLQWVFRIALGLFSNRMYMTHCVEKARKLREKYPDDKHFRTAARKQGGRSTFFMYVTGALTVLYMLFTMWSGISF